MTVICVRGKSDLDRQLSCPNYTPCKKIFIISLCGGVGDIVEFIWKEFCVCCFDTVKNEFVKTNCSKAKCKRCLESNTTTTVILHRSRYHYITQSPLTWTPGTPSAPSETSLYCQRRTDVWHPPASVLSSYEHEYALQGPLIGT